MTDDDEKHEIKKLLGDLNTYLAQVAITNPKQLPAALSEVAADLMRFEMVYSMTEFLKAFSDRLDELNKGDKNMFNPQNIDAEELTLINDRIRAIQAEIGELRERKTSCNDPEGLKDLDDYIQRKKRDLVKLKQERKYILRRGFEH